MFIAEPFQLQNRSLISVDKFFNGNVWAKSEIEMENTCTAFPFENSYDLFLSFITSKNLTLSEYFFVFIYICSRRNITRTRAFLAFRAVMKIHRLMISSRKTGECIRKTYTKDGRCTNVGGGNIQSA